MPVEVNESFLFRTQKEKQKTNEKAQKSLTPSNISGVSFNPNQNRAWTVQEKKEKNSEDPFSKTDTNFNRFRRRGTLAFLIPDLIDAPQSKENQIPLLSCKENKRDEGILGNKTRASSSFHSNNPEPNKTRLLSSATGSTRPKKPFHKKSSSMSAEITSSSYYNQINLPAQAKDRLRPTTSMGEQQRRPNVISQARTVQLASHFERSPEPRMDVGGLRKKISKIYLQRHIESIRKKLNISTDFQSLDQKLSRTLQNPKQKTTICNIFSLNSKMLRFLEQKSLVLLTFEVSRFMEIGFAHQIPEFLAVGFKLLHRLFFMNAEFSKAFFFSNQIRILGEFLRSNILKIDGLVGMSDSCQRESFKYSQVANDYLKKALEFAWHSNDSVAEAKVYDKMGELFFGVQNIDLSVFYHRRGLLPALEPKDSAQRIQGVRFAQIYWNSKDIISLEPFSEKSKKYFAIPCQNASSLNIFGTSSLFDELDHLSRALRARLCLIGG